MPVTGVGCKVSKKIHERDKKKKKKKKDDEGIKMGRREGTREKEREGWWLFFCLELQPVSLAHQPAPLLLLAGSPAPDGEPGYCPNGSSVFIITSAYASTPPLCPGWGVAVIDN